MRVLVTSPYGWPDVRRGAEREAHELTGGLRALGLDARMLTGTAHGLTARAEVAGAPVRYLRTPRRAGWPEPGPGFAAVTLAAAVLTRPDVVHCLHYADAYGAVRSGRRVVLKLTGTVKADRVSGLDARLFRSALARADEVWVNSAYAAREMAEFGRELRVIPAGIDLTRFAPARRDDRPLIVCAAAGDEPRKRVVDLLEAWPAIRRRLPGARLALAGASPGSGQAPADVQVLGVLTDDALAALYARAWVVVAPAVHEALGLVTLEALASGTPVAGACSGATADLLSPPGVGALAAPLDPGSLADAVLAAAQLAGEPATAARCRAAAEPFGWDRVLPQVLAGYERVRRN